MKFTLTIPPKAQMRARHRAFKAGDHIYQQTYKDPKQEQEEDRLITLLMEHRPAVPLTGPLMLGVLAFLPIPTGFSKKKRAAALAGELRPTTKPDLDNLIKHIKDCCKGIFWGDDKEVVGYLEGTGKYYGDLPRWEIEILTLEEFKNSVGEERMTADQVEEIMSTPKKSGMLF